VRIWHGGALGGAARRRLCCAREGPEPARAAKALLQALYELLGVARTRVELL